MIASNFTTRGGLFQIQAPAAYIEFDGLRLDGKVTNAEEAFHILQHAHHIRAIGNVITNMGSAGIASSQADYLTFIGNRIYRFGDGYGWSSGISLNSNEGAWWFDQGDGFHNVIVNNIIAGGVDNSDHHSDGNGIILDLGGGISPTLIANNVVYMNGGSGIVSFGVEGRVYVVNNTLYKNGLDLRVTKVGELFANQASGEVWANNIASAWTGRATYRSLNSGNIFLDHNAQFGGIGPEGVSESALADAGEIITTMPLFQQPPHVDPSADSQWRSAPAPGLLGNGLQLQPGSPLVDAGVDPRNLPGLDTQMRADMAQYLLRSINGVRRPAGRSFDYGAYEN